MSRDYCEKCGLFRQDCKCCMAETLDVVLKDAKDLDKFIDDRGNIWQVINKQTRIFNIKDATSFSVGVWDYIALPGLRPLAEKKTVRMAPALTRKPNILGKGYIYDFSYFFASREDAEEHFKDGPGKILKWPANDTMWVEVEVDEND